MTHCRSLVIPLLDLLHLSTANRISIRQNKDYLHLSKSITPSNALIRSVETGRVAVPLMISTAAHTLYMSMQSYRPWCEGQITSPHRTTISCAAFAFSRIVALALQRTA